MVNGVNAMLARQLIAPPSIHQSINTADDFLKLIKEDKGNKAEIVFQGLLARNEAQQPSFVREPKALAQLFFAAMEQEQYALAERIIDTRKMDLTATSEFGSTLPITAAANAGKESMIEKLSALQSPIHCALGTRQNPVIYCIAEKCSPGIVEQLCINFFTEEKLHSPEAALVIAELLDAGSVDENCYTLGLKYYDQARSLFPQPTWLTEESEEISQLFCACITCCNNVQDGKIKKEIETIIDAIFPYVDPDHLDQYNEDEEQRPIMYVIENQDREKTREFCLRGAHIGKMPEGWEISIVDWMRNEFDEKFVKNILQSIDLQKNYSQLMQELTYVDDRLALLLCKRLEREQPAWWQQRGMKEFIFYKALEQQRIGLSRYLLERIDVTKVPKTTTIEYLTLEEGIQCEEETIQSLAFTALKACEQNLMFKRVVKRLFELGADFSAEEPKQYFSEHEISAYEKVSEIFFDDIPFIKQLLQKCPIAWLKRYYDIMCMLENGQRHEEAYAAIQEALSSATPEKWVTDQDRCAILFQLAVCNQAKEVALLLVDKITTFKSDYLALIANNWMDILQTLLERCNFGYQQPKKLCANSRLVHFVSTRFPVTNNKLTVWLTALIDSNKKRSFITLVNRILSTTPIPSWFNGYEQRSVYKYAMQIGEIDIACAVAQIVSEKEAEYFLSNTIQHSFFQSAQYVPSIIPEWLQEALECKHVLLIGTLLRLQSDATKVQLFIEQVSKVLSKQELTQLYQTMPLSEQSSYLVYEVLCDRKQGEYADILFDRLTVAGQNVPSFAKTISFRGALICKYIAGFGDKEKIRKLLTPAILSFVTSEPSRKSVCALLEGAYGDAFVEELLTTMDTTQWPETVAQLLDFVRRGKKKWAKLVFDRLINTKTANYEKLIIVFLKLIAANDQEFAEPLLEKILQDARSVSYKGLIHGRSLLMAVAVFAKSTFRKTLMDTILERGASLSGVDDNGKSAFSYVHAHYPEITTKYIETCSLQDNQSSLFAILVRENFFEFAITLYSRLQSLPQWPRWWTGKTRANLFFAMLPHMKTNSRAREIVDCLLRDEALDVCTTNNKGLNVIQCALEAKVEKSIIDSLITRGKKGALLQFSRVAKSTLMWLGAYQKNEPVHKVVEQFCKEIGITVKPTSTYGSIIQMLLHAVRDNKVSRYKRVIYALITGDQHWIEHLKNCSFAERHEYILMVGQKLNGAYVDRLIDGAFPVDSCHYADRTMPTTMPSPSAPIEIGVLRELFLLYKDTEQSQEKIEAFIERIIQKKKDIATPSETSALDAFYKTIEDQVLLVLDYFRKSIAVIEKTSSKTLIEEARTNTEAADLLRSFRAYCDDCITVTGYCGTRLQNHARSYYVQYVLKQKYDFLSQMRSELAEFRTTLAEAFVTNDPQSVHAYNAFLLRYGKQYGIPGSEDEIKDKFISGHQEQVERAKECFIQSYSPSAIIHFMGFVLKNGNNRESFINFLQNLDSEARRSYESYSIDMLVDKMTKNCVDAHGVIASEVERKKIQDFFSEAPYYITLSDAAVSSREAIKQALSTKENRDRQLFAFCEFPQDKQNRYSKLGILLLLIELKVLKL